MPGEGQVFYQTPEDQEEFKDQALLQAEAVCQRRGARLTRLRRRVLEILWNENRPVGAYYILDILRDERKGAAPPTVYRVLDFLVEQGLAHRIERLNAFLGCRTPDQPHTAQFMICKVCGLVAELHNEEIDHAVHVAASEVDFTADISTIEIEGVCPKCREAGKGLAE